MSLSIYGANKPFSLFQSGRIPQGMSYYTNASGIVFTGLPTANGRYVSYWMGPFPNPATHTPVTLTCPPIQSQSFDDNFTKTLIGNHNLNNYTGYDPSQNQSGQCDHVDGGVATYLTPADSGLSTITFGFECALGGCHEGVGHVTITSSAGAQWDGNPHTGGLIVLSNPPNGATWQVHVRYDGSGHCCDRAVFNSFVYTRTSNDPDPRPDECLIGNICPPYRNNITGQLEYICSQLFAVVIIVGTGGVQDPLPTIPYSEAELQQSPITWGQAFRALRETPNAYVRRQSWTATKKIYIDYQSIGTNKVPYFDDPIQANSLAGILFRDENGGLVSASTITAGDYTAGDWVVLGATPSTTQDAPFTLKTQGVSVPSVTGASGSRVALGTPLYDGLENQSVFNATIYAPANVASLYSTHFFIAPIDGLKFTMIAVEEGISGTIGTTLSQASISLSQATWDDVFELKRNGEGSNGYDPSLQGEEGEAIPFKITNDASESRSCLVRVSVPSRDFVTKLTLSGSLHRE